MKNSPLTAVVMLALVALVGGVIWMAWPDEALDTTPVEAGGVTLADTKVMDITPWEARKKGRMEAAHRKIEDYKRKGKVLENGSIKVPDVDGSPLYVHPELIEGTGRFGEPLYAMARYKRRAAVPVRREIKSLIPDAGQPTVKRLPKGETPLKFGEKPEHMQMLEAGGGVGDGEGGDEPGSGENRDKPGKNG